MFNFRKLGILTTVLVALTACEGTGTMATTTPGLATQGNLSADAIKLQTQTERLLTLEQEQSAARKRQSNFTMQGAVIGAGLGALLGNFTCNNCSDAERKQRMIQGAVLGGGGGAIAGNAQANQQNDAASAENELRRRITLASDQLTAARTARSQAEQIAKTNKQRLAKVRSDVAAGRATQAQLDVARADAQADASQVLSASRAMNGSAKSMDQSGNGISQDLKNIQISFKNEESKTNAAYNLLIESTANSPL
jgi:hypothetical protein